MITVTARPYKINFTGNAIWYEFYSPDAAGDPSISFEVRVVIIRGAVISTLAEVPLVPFAGKAVFNAASYLDPELEYDLPTLDDDAAVLVTSKQSIAFYVEFREVNPANANPAWDASESEIHRWAVKGGIPEMKFNNNGFWKTYYPAAKPFLTWQYRGRLVAYSERFYLLWYHEPDNTTTDFSVEIAILYSDLSQGKKTIAYHAAANEMAYIPAGGAMHDLQAINPAKRIFRWQVKLFDNSNPAAPVLISEAFNVELDNRPDYKDIQLLYRNSLGGIDTLRIRGLVETSASYAMQTTGAIRKPYYDDGERVSASEYQLPAQESIVYKGDIGHLNKEEQDRLRDVYLRREIYLVRAKKWLPVNFTIKNFSLRKSTDQLWSLPIEYTLATDGDFYYAPAGADFGNEKADKNVCDAIIARIVSIVTTFPNDVDCDIELTVEVSSASGQNVTRLQWKSETTDWAEVAYPGGMPIRLTRPKNGFVVVTLRAICPNEMGGLSYPIAITTYNPADPPGGGGGGGGVPPANNSRITNNTALAIIYTIRLNGDIINTARVEPGQFIPFYLPDTVNGTLEVTTPGVNVSDATNITSNGSIRFATIGLYSFRFTAIDITGGANIEMR